MPQNSEANNMGRKFKDDVILGHKVKYVDAGSGMIFAKVVGMPKEKAYMGTGINKTQAKKDVTRALTAYNKKHMKTVTQKKTAMKKLNSTTNDKTEAGIIKSFKRAVKDGKLGTASDKYEEYKKAIRTAEKKGAPDTRIKNMRAHLKTMAKLRIERERLIRMKAFQ